MTHRRLSWVGLSLLGPGLRACDTSSMKAAPDPRAPGPGDGALADLESWLRSPLRLAILLAIATVIATAATSFGEVELRRAWGGGPEERDLVLRQGVVWLAWALLVLPLSALAGAIARRAKGWPAALACHVPIAALVASLFLVLENSLTAWAQGPERTQQFRERVLGQDDPRSTRRRPPWERPELRDTELRASAPGRPEAEGQADPRLEAAEPPTEGAVTTERTARPDGREGRDRGDSRRGRGDWRRRTWMVGFVTGDVLLDFQRRWTLRVPRYALIYFAVIGLGLGARSFLVGRARERKAAALELQTSQLESALTAAQLTALKSQLHPHFLFNALHSVGGMIRTERSAEALGALARIGDLLRTSLDAGPEQFVSLGREIELAERYLEVEQMRLGDRLKVDLEVAPALTAAEVPAFITQPLVENAVKHGIATSSEGGTVRLRASASADGTRMRIDIEDDGAGVVEGSPDGVGLQNVRSRLRALFEADAKLEVELLEEGGTRARITLPLDDLEPLPGAAEDEAPSHETGGAAPRGQGELR